MFFSLKLGGSWASGHNRTLDYQSENGDPSLLIANRALMVATVASVGWFANKAYYGFTTLNIDLGP